MAAPPKTLNLRQSELIALMRGGKVLRRRGTRRTYSLCWPGTDTTTGFEINSAEVGRLQVRYFDAFDAATGEPVRGGSAFTSTLNLEFRLKPEHVL